MQIILIGMVLTSCVGTKYLGKNEQVLISNSLKGVGAGQRGNIEPQIVQNPNTRFLWSGGPAHRVAIYQFGKKNFLFHYDSVHITEKKEELIRKFDRKIAATEKANKERRLLTRKQRKIAKKDKALIEGNQFMRWGEEVVVYDSVATMVSIENMVNQLNTRGYFSSKIHATTESKGKNKKKVSVTYHIDKGPAYILDSIFYEISDWRVKEMIQGFDENFSLKTGVPIRQDDLAAERDRVYNIMVNNGYYDFSKNLIYFEVDTVTLDKHKVLLKEVIASPPNSFYHKLYVIDSVIFVTDAGGSSSKNIPNEDYDQLTYTFGRFKYSPKILNWHNQIYPDKIYQRDKVLETQRQLSYIDNFKFINVNFDTLGSQFIAHIFTSPADKYQTSLETGFSVTQGLPGPFATLNLKNRNLFHGLEITELNTFFKLEGNPGVTSQKASYSSVQYGAEVSVTLPQFLIPMIRFYKKKIAQYNPRTRFGLAFNQENRIDNYDRATFNASTAYIWKAKDHISYTFTPMMISYINSDIKPAFQAVLDDLSATSNSFASTFNSSFVSAGSFQLVINDNHRSTRYSDYLQLYLETGGHLFSAFGQEPFGNQLEYFKYTKGNIDVRRLQTIHPRLSVAMRMNVGAAVPYGSNRALPYEKYFFAGGSNSIRAWRPRRLGPGAYGLLKSDGTISYEREQPGDFIMETSLELRQKLSGFVDGALFIDAGNIWLINSQTVEPDQEGDDGVLRANTMLKELAVGAGFGIRFDMSFLIFRLDIGWKLVDPAQPLGQRYVGNENDIAYFDKTFPYFHINKPFSKAAFNIGIGYPF